MNRIEWVSVIALLVALFAVIATFSAWINFDEMCALIGFSIVMSVLSLRGR